MERHLKSDRFGVDLENECAEDQWLHWHQTFINFLEECDSTDSSI